MKLHGAPSISLVDSGLAKRRRDRRLRTFWWHGHLSMKMAVATTKNHSNNLYCVTQLQVFMELVYTSLRSHPLW